MRADLVPVRAMKNNPIPPFVPLESPESLAFKGLTRMTRRFPLSLFALATLIATAAVCHPATPTPPAPTVDLVSVTTSPAMAGCAFTLTPSTGQPAPATWSQPGLPTTTAVITYTGAQPWGATVTGLCPGSQPVSAVVVLSGASQSVTLGPLVPSAPPVPPVQPLPVPPTRDQLARVHACFQGLMVTTQQLGTVPSFGGVETGMLTAAADRQTTYAAIRAAGCTHIVLDVFCHYTEGGVQYPNQTACSNDWTTDNNATLTARVAEAVNAGLDVLLMQGCDELAFSICASQVPGEMLALRSYPGGDLTRFIVLCTGFDSIWPIANAPPAATSNQTLVSLLLADRAAIGPAGVMAIEWPAGVSFGGDGALAGRGWYTSPAGQTLDVILQEFASVSPGNGPPPTIISGYWNVADSLYSPNWSGDATAWDQVWQIALRTVSRYSAPPDQPFNVIVPVTGGPQAGQSAPVSDDAQSYNPYTSGGTPRGRFYVIGFESSTFQFTHGQATVAQVMANCRYLSGIGYDAIACPTTPSTSASVVPLFSRRPRPANNPVTTRQLPGAFRQPIKHRPAA